MKMHPSVISVTLSGEIDLQYVFHKVFHGATVSYPPVVSRNFC